MTLIGYARCSTDKQDLAAQKAALGQLGVSADRIYTDHGLTGTNRSRPGLDQALAAVRTGDTLVVPKLDRLARSVPDARSIADALVARGVKLALGASVYDPINPMGKMFFNILATFAEFEADLIRLGLSMIYGFARQSGGQVRIYSEVGQGTTMCLYLPRHHGQVDGADAEAELSEAPRAEQGETVLVVDDEPTVRMLVTEVLEDLGYTAIEAVDGAAGLKVLRSDVRINLLITDVGLPGGMNGRQVADAGRAVRPGLKVLFITGYAENAVVGNGHLEPGMQVLTKPFAIDALASRIKELTTTS